MKNNFRVIRMREFVLDVGAFAKMLEVDSKTYSNWEKERSQPKLEIAIKVAKKLNRKVEDIWLIDE